MLEKILHTHLGLSCSQAQAVVAKVIARTEGDYTVGSRPGRTLVEVEGDLNKARQGLRQSRRR